MKTTLQKKKYTLEEIKKKQATLSNMKTESAELSKTADDESIYKDFTNIESKLNKFDDKCKEEIKVVEKEIEDFNTYTHKMQETEKWLLQISFQLMAHNSLYISNR